MRTAKHCLTHARLGPLSVIARPTLHSASQPLTLSSTCTALQVVDEADGSESKYWYEVQRLGFQGKLGNLVLLPFEEAGAGAVATADYDVKAAYFRKVREAISAPLLSMSLCHVPLTFPLYSFPAPSAAQRKCSPASRARCPRPRAAMPATNSALKSVRRGMATFSRGSWKSST